MKTIDNYIGIEPFTVLVDDSVQLQDFAAQARELKDLPFPEKLAAVKKLALDSMVNAYEQLLVWGKKGRDLESAFQKTGDRDKKNEMYQAYQEADRFKKIVFEKHPLSYALQKAAGCCRYQGTLFFILGYEAELGEKHFMHTAPVNGQIRTVFNEIVQGGEEHKVSIFTESLKDKSFDYSRQNPNIFEQAIETLPGYNFYSYHRTPNGLVMIENPSRHVKEL